MLTACTLCQWLESNLDCPSCEPGAQLLNHFAIKVSLLEIINSANKTIYILQESQMNILNSSFFQPVSQAGG